MKAWCESPSSMSMSGTVPWSSKHSALLFKPYDIITCSSCPYDRSATTFTTCQSIKAQERLGESWGRQLYHMWISSKIFKPYPYSPITHDQRLTSNNSTNKADWMNGRHYSIRTAGSVWSYLATEYASRGCIRLWGGQRIKVHVVHAGEKGDLECWRGRREGEGTKERRKNSGEKEGVPLLVCLR